MTASDAKNLGKTADASADGQPDLGMVLRSLRLERRMSGAALAAAAGVTPAAVSQIESGTIQPSITTLRRLASGLGEPVFRFFLPEGRIGGTVVRQGERKRLAMPHGSVVYELLTPDLNGALEVLELRLDPGEVSAEVPLSHTGEECFLVNSGQASMQVGEEVYRLDGGDAVTFRGELPHRVTNVGDGKLVALSIITPPAF